jgi:CheY-like chemotaxis protein
MVRANSIEARLPSQTGACVVSPQRILVIEDDRDAAATLALLLQVWGHEVEVARSGPEGLEAARRFVPATVLCDLGLPGGLDGCGVARALRADQAMATTFLIALTGYATEEDHREAKAAGFDVFLTKPVDPATLRHSLSTRPC